jgi:hypothetical protein
MHTVGPTLPPHFQKRKRSPPAAEDPTSPPSKIRAASPPRVLGPVPPPKNPDELEIQNESSEDDYGPSIQTKPKPETPRPTKQVLGPAAPPPSQNPDELDLQDVDSENDDYGPSAQPKPAAVVATAKPILGPAPPPANLSERPSYPANDSDSSSDDDYGPSLPPAPGSAAAGLLERRAQQDRDRLSADAKAAESAKPQRAEWMLAPPSDSDWTSRVDPTKLKNRKFASGKGAKAPAEKSGVSAIWTETPEEKRKRLEDQVLGRVDKDASASSTSRGKGSGKADTREEREAEETARRIREYNERNRNKSLMDEIQGGEKGVKEKEDDPSKRGFDREKDMALGGRLGHVEKREMLAKAKDFGSRFQKGRYL